MSAAVRTSGIASPPAPRPRDLVLSLLRALVLFVPPAAVVLITPAIERKLWPWQANLEDFNVFREAGRLALEGQPFYGDAIDVPFLYPPFAALGAVPLAAVPEQVAEIAWLLVMAGLVMAMVHRAGFTGWQTSLIAAAILAFVEPQITTIGYGQINTVITALVVLDLMPGPRLLPQRILPQGTLTGIAAAIKLTPVVFVGFLLLAGRWRASLTAAASFAGAAIVGFIAMPAESAYFWLRLTGGESGRNEWLGWMNNQSAAAAWLRFTGHEGLDLPLGALLLSAFVGLLGMAAAVWWARAGDFALGVALCGLASLYAAPIAWSHHFIWVIPLGLVLLTHTGLPPRLRAYGLLTAGWIAWAPFTKLASGQRAWLDYSTSETLLASGSLLLGIGLFAVALAYAIRRRRQIGLPGVPRRYVESVPHVELRSPDHPATRAVQTVGGSGRT